MTRPERMRAAEIREPGRPPVVADREPPVPGDGEVLVDVLAAPITPLDLLCATGTSYFGRPATPYVPGVQGVGIAGGRTVWFPCPAGMAPGDGSMAEAAAVPEAALVTLPDGADPASLAALGLSAVAAHMALTWRGELAAGEQVVVLGAGGVVGQAAVRLARAAGARRVVAGARSADGRERARRAGADAVVALDTADVAELGRRFAGAADGPVDLVLDPLFGAPAAAAAGALRPGGRLVNLGSSAGETCPIESSTIRGRSLRVLGYTNNELTPEQRAESIAFVAERAAAGELAVAHETVPLEDAAEAWRRQAEGTAAGRIVLTPRPAG
ncbi:quinone oxidoreductase family protein [Actinomadura madurae]|uniref:quinone oxidoreductase family protein n=1 Tax=Actinomadura madurae TaxID=1993 RepID=UPI0020D20199|nr:zinc-binding alcohol dehydrogenase family protein [Actinomadura madurae]MCP9948523.1 zinc-binding alcohol dehydrogenase family protein [Actinomadura madurae]MCP9965304.1 zinc-binding alcohol dehydrogenase family protein [Actinomadura madurae]MCP9977790.1 zinc-binding alcohol dehydrogenase family protein [Actinomadura madurae]